MDLLSGKNIWFRQQALLILGDRKNASLVPYLMQMLQGTDAQNALEALWAINLSGGFTGDVLNMALGHNDPFVRMWAVRLIGDSKKVSPAIADELAQLSMIETHPEVRSQLAATAKRLPPADAITIIKNLLNKDDSADPDIPLQIWWAMEAIAESNRKEVNDLFEDRKLWSNPAVSKTILTRLMQRYIIAGGEENHAACSQLFKLAPSEEYAAILFNGLQEGLRGRDVADLSSVLTDALKPYKKLFREQSLAIDIRMGKKEALHKALQIIGDENAELPERLSYIRIFSEISQPAVIPVLLKLVETSTSAAIRQASLLALQNYDNEETGVRVVKAYPDKLRGDVDVREAAISLLASRVSWASQLINAITKTRTIDQSDIPEHIVWQMKMLKNDAIAKSTEKLWPHIKPATAQEKNSTIAQVVKSMKAGKGDPAAGHPLFIAKCGTCHKLFNEGRSIAPDLTGYDRKNLDDMLNNIVDPSAYIREGYGTWHVTTTDGRTIIGMLKAKNDKTVTIQPFTGEPVTVSATQVSNLEPLETSIMPERLLDGLNDKQLRDFFSYLMK